MIKGIYSVDFLNRVMKGSHLDAECVPAAADYKWNLFLEIFPSRSRACVCLVCFCRDIYLFTFTHVSRGILKCARKRACQMCCQQPKHVTQRILFAFIIIIIIIIVVTIMAIIMALTIIMINIIIS